MRIFIITVLALGFIGVGIPAFNAQAGDDANKPLRQINVSGECVRQVTPDKGIVTATANKIDPKDVSKASKDVMDQYKKFQEKVKTLGLKDMVLQTSDYSVQPIYSWVQPKPEVAGKNVLQGYQARLGLRVETTSIDRLGDVITAAAETGIQEVGGFQMAVSKILEQKIRNECLAEAVGNARAQATLMANAAGAKLGKPLSISDSYRGPVFPMVAAPMMAKMAVGAADMAESAPQIQAGQTDIQVNVQATFELE